MVTRSGSIPVSPSPKGRSIIRTGSIISSMYGSRTVADLGLYPIYAGRKALIDGAALRNVTAWGERVEELDGAPLKLDRSTTETGRPQNRSWGESEGEGRGAIVLALTTPAIVCGGGNVEVLSERRGRARRIWRWISQQRSHRVMNG